MRLRPSTRRIIVVAGTVAPDHRHLALAKTALERHAQGLEIRYLAGLTLTETLAALRAIPSDSVVLDLTVFRDAGVRRRCGATC